MRSFFTAKNFTRFLLISLWGFTLIHYRDLTSTIPIHFNTTGQPDAYDTKIHVWGLPIIASLLYFLFNFLGKRKQITVAEKRLLNQMQLLIVGIFSYIQLHVFLVAFGLRSGLGKWFLPLSMALFFIPIVSTIFQQQKKD